MITRSMNTRTRVLGWATIVTLIALAAVAVYTYFAYQQAASALLVERDSQVAYLSASRLRDELTGFSDLLYSIGRTREIALGDDEAQRQELFAARNRLSVFDGGVVLLDNFGRVVATQPEREGILGDDWSNRDFFLALLATPSAYFSNASSDGPFGARVVVVSVPLQGEESEFAGALAGMFRLGEPSISSFYASIVRLRLGQTGNTYVVDGKSNLLFDSGAGASQSQPGTAIDIGKIAGLSIEGDGGAVRTRNGDGREVVAAYAPVPGTGWTLVMQDDWVELTRPTRRYARLLLSLLGLGMALPALGVALLLRQRNTDILQREQSDQGIRVASLIQRTLLPKQIPMVPGWSIKLHHQPCPGVGGDFYDALLLPDGRLMIALAHIADRGVTTAVVMATTRAAIHSAANRRLTPAEALVSINALLCSELDAGDSVRCMVAILDPSSGNLSLAIAGHSPPYVPDARRAEFKLDGMPLGRNLNAKYEQVDTVIKPGEGLVFVGEGLISAKNDRGQVLGNERLQAVLDGLGAGGERTVGRLLVELSEFVGPGREQVDDVTIISLDRQSPRPLHG